MRSLRLSGRLAALSLIVLLAVASNFKAMTARKVAAVPPYKITAIKAMLFYNGTGTFSRDILSPPMTLWNTIIGEGEAGAPSEATMVLVEISGKTNDDPNGATRKVELTATIDGKVVVKRATDIGLFSDQGKFYAPFWVYDTGCGKLRLTARILGQTQASSMTKSITFGCGE
jgi:hypothetical protein